MRVHAAFDKDGRVIALAEIVEADGERVGVRLLPSEDRTIGQLEVPSGYVDKPLSELVAHYRVEEGPRGPRFTHW